MAGEIVLAANDSGERPPTRIAFCITDLDVGGAERMFVELVTRLDRRRWEPRVYCLSKPGALAARLEATGISVTCFNASNLKIWSVVSRLASELNKFQPWLLQSFLYHANLAGRVAARMAGVPQVVSGIRVAERRGRWRLWVDWLTQSFVDHNVCVSQAVAKFSIRRSWLKTAKVSVIPNGVDFDRFANATPIDRVTFGFSQAAPLVLFVGRLDPQKAPFVLLEAFARLIDRHADWQLLFVGDGPLRDDMQRWIVQRKLESSIRLVGWRADVPGLLKSADALALPSLWEGMPNIVLESMAAGLPVVVSHVEGTDELIRDGETGLLVTPGSVEELEQKIEKVLLSGELLTSLSKYSQHTVLKDFTIESMVEKYEQLYVRLLEKRSPSAS